MVDNTRAFQGSVALKMARSLELGGVKTGLFVSPHVSCFRERMLVNGEMIAEREVEDILPQVKKTLSPVRERRRISEETHILAWYVVCDTQIC